MALTGMATMSKITIIMQTITEAAMGTLATIPLLENIVLATEAMVP